MGRPNLGAKIASATISRPSTADSFEQNKDNAGRLRERRHTSSITVSITGSDTKRKQPNVLAPRTAESLVALNASLALLCQDLHRVLSEKSLILM